MGIKLFELKKKVVNWQHCLKVVSVANVVETYHGIKKKDTGIYETVYLGDLLFVLHKLSNTQIFHWLHKSLFF